MATNLGEVTTEKKKIRQNSSKKSDTKNADTNNKKDGQDSVVDEDINMEVKKEPAKDATNSIKPNPVFGIMGSGNNARRIAQLLADGNIAAKIFDKDTDKPIKVAEIKIFAESVDIILSCYDIPDQISMDLCRGVIKLLSAGKGFVQMSVIDHKYSVDFNELCKKNGIKYLESIIFHKYYDRITMKLTSFEISPAFPIRMMSDLFIADSLQSLAKSFKDPSESFIEQLRVLKLNLV